MSIVRAVSQRFPRIGGRLCVVALLLGLGLVACQSDEQKLASFQERAEVYVEAGQYKEAVIEYRNILQIDPSSVEAHRGLAEAYLRLGEISNAYWELSETIRIDPTDTEARNTYAVISLGNGRYEEALIQADALLEMDADNSVALVLRAQSLERLGRADEVAEILQRVAGLEPDKPEFRLLLGSFYVRQGEAAEGEKATREALAIKATFAGYAQLARFLAVDPTRDVETEELFKKAIDAATTERAEYLATPEEEREGAGVDSRAAVYKTTAGFYLLRGREADAIDLLTESLEALSDSPKDRLELMYMLAGIHRSSGDEDKANELIKAATLADPSDPEPFLVLSVYLGGEGDHEGSLEAARQAEEADPSSLKARLRLAEALIDSGLLAADPDLRNEGRALVEQVLVENPGMPEGLFVQAKLALSEDDPALAIESLTAALEAKPDWSQGRFVLGTALLKVGELSRARVEIARALELDPNLTSARRSLIQIHAALGEHEYAIDQSERYLAERPNDKRARILYAQSLVRLGRIDKAFEVLSAIPAEDREAPTRFALSRIYLARGQLAEARKELEYVEGEMPNHDRVLETYLSLDRAENRIADSRTRVDAAVEASPDQASLREIQGLVALIEGDQEKAEASYKKALEIDPQSLGAYEKLAELYRTQGRIDDTIAIYERAVQEQPDASSAHHFLAVLYEMTGKPQKARQHYEAAVQSDEGMAESKNNLAYLLATSGEDLDRALTLAQEAKAQLPGNANTADTLGWVLLKRGVPSAAIGYFREALTNMAPSDAARGEVGYHLALAYEAAGDKEKAIAALTEALQTLGQQLDARQSEGKASTEPPWASQARSQLNRLSS